MASPFTTVKGDEFTRLTPAGIIRCLQVQDPAGAARGDAPKERCDPRGTTHTGSVSPALPLTTLGIFVTFFPETGPYVLVILRIIFYTYNYIDFYLNAVEGAFSMVGHPVPVSLRALLHRLHRQLAQQERGLTTGRGTRYAHAWKRSALLPGRSNRVAPTPGDGETWARALGVFRAWERVASAA